MPLMHVSVQAVLRINAKGCGNNSSSVNEETISGIFSLSVSSSSSSTALDNFSVLANVSADVPDSAEGGERFVFVLCRPGVVIATVSDVFRCSRTIFGGYALWFKSA